MTTDPLPQEDDAGPCDASRDAGQFAGFYARWRVPLMRMLRRYIDSPDAADDASQEVFARMAAAGKVLRTEDERAYLRRSARSMVGEAWRKHPGRHGVQVVAASQCEDELLNVEASDDASPDIVAEHRQRLARLNEAIAELPERQRQAFVLHRVEGRTVEETAERMGISVRMAVKHLSRALSYCQARVLYANAAQMRQLHARRSSPDDSLTDAPAAPEECP